METAALTNNDVDEKCIKEKGQENTGAADGNVLN